MAITRVHTWSAGEILLASDLNSEFNNVIGNGSDLVSPFTKAISMGGFAFNLDAANIIAFTATTSGVALTGGTLREPTQDTVTAFAGGGQANATALTAATKFHRVSVCATAADSYKLPTSTAGQAHYVRNDGAAAAQAFGSGTDTINGVATGTGIPHPVGVGIWFVCTTAGNWTTGPLVAVSGNFPVTLTATASTNVTLPTTGTLATLAGSESLTNKTITVKDANFTVQDDGDVTKQLQLQLSGISAGATRVITPPDQNLSLIALAGICEGRLTLTSGTAITISDVTAASTVYFTPYKGSRIATYSGSAWNVSVFTEKSVSVPATTVTPFDVFVVDGTLALETVNWTNDTTRATAITLQDGVYVKSGTTTRRYLGTCRTTGVSGQTEDSIAKRYVWNYYNRFQRKMLVQETTSTWNYTTATYRQANGSTSNQLDMVIGVQEDPVKAFVNGAFFNSGATQLAAQVGIGVDSTTVNSADLFPRNANESGSAGAYAMTIAQWEGYPGIGRHFLAWLEISPAGGTTTWAGTSADTGIATTHSGIAGEFLG